LVLDTVPSFLLPLPAYAPQFDPVYSCVNNFFLNGTWNSHIDYNTVGYSSRYAHFMLTDSRVF